VRTLVQPAAGAAFDDESIDAYLADIGAWRSATSTALLELDEQVKIAALPDATADVGLAFSLWRAASTRVDEVAAARGVGGLGDDERAAVQRLVWAPLVDDTGASLASNLPEARTLVDALVARARAGVADRGQRIATVTGLLAPLTQRVQQARADAEAVGELVRQVEVLSSRLAKLGPDSAEATVIAEVAAIEQALAPIERDLRELAQAKGALADDVGALPDRVLVAEQLEAATRELVARCAQKVADPPNLAVPDVGALGPPPAPADILALEWRAGRAAVDAYAARLERVERALALANAAYAAPLARRDDLRGLLDGYRAMAASRGLGEAPDASAAYDAARAALYRAPCDLDAAAALVERYQHVVRGATGAPPTPEDRR
jgi:hypothetical protein